MWPWAMLLYLRDIGEMQVAGGDPPLRFSLPHFTNKATPRSFNFQTTPIKCRNLDDTSGQLKLEGWRDIFFIAYTLFHKEAPCYWQLGGWGSILLVTVERRPVLLANSEGRHYFVG
mgnify:FL=1